MRLSPVSCRPRSERKASRSSAREGGDFGFDRRGDDHRLGAFGRGSFEHALRQCVAGRGIAFVDVADVEHRLRGQQLRALQRFFFLVVLGLGQPCGLGRAQQARAPGRAPTASIFASLSPCCAFLTRLGTRLSRLSRSASISSVSTVSASAIGSTRPFDVGHVAALEAAQHVDDRVDLADVGEELVAEPFALGWRRGPGRRCRRTRSGSRSLAPTWRSRGSCRAARRARRRGRRWARSCRTDNWPPARRQSRSSALKSVDLPTFGRPTMPQRKPM